MSIQIIVCLVYRDCIFILCIVVYWCFHLVASQPQTALSMNGRNTDYTQIK